MSKVEDQSQLHTEKFWNENAVKYDRDFNGYSTWSTVRRFAAITKKVNKNTRVAELFAGAGNFELFEGPFDYYLACDFAEVPLELSRADRKIKYDILKNPEVALNACVEDNIDWIILCGGFPMRHIAEKIDPPTFMEKCFKIAKRGVIANFGSDYSHIKWQSYMYAHSPIEILTRLSKYHPSLDQSYLPHEFLVTIEHPQRDWR